MTRMPQMSTVIFISHLNHNAEAILLYKARIDKTGYHSFIMNGEYANSSILNKGHRQRETGSIEPIGYSVRR